MGGGPAGVGVMDFDFLASDSAAESSLLRFRPEDEEEEEVDGGVRL